MHPVAYATTFTLMYYTFCIIAKIKHNFITFLILFIAILGVGYATRAHAMEFHEYANEMPYLTDKELRKKISYHDMQGNICYYTAQKYSWYYMLPEDTEKAKLCFETAIVALAPADPKHKAIAMVLALFHNVGLSMIERYHEINSKLCEGRYHHEMYLFYQQIHRQRHGYAYDPDLKEELV